MNTFDQGQKGQNAATSPANTTSTQPQAQYQGNNNFQQRNNFQQPQNNGGQFGGYQGRNQGNNRGNFNNNNSPANRPPYQNNNNFNQQQSPFGGVAQGAAAWSAAPQTNFQPPAFQAQPGAGQTQPSGFPATPNFVAGGAPNNFGQAGAPAAATSTVPQGPVVIMPLTTVTADGKPTRWGQSISHPEIAQFVTMYMPWVVDQRRRAQQEAGYTQDQNFTMSGILGGIGSIKDPNATATNLLKQDDNKAIEQTQQYKQLLRYNPAAAAAMKSGVKCPERLAIYIERAFSKCISDNEREFMREQLEQICTTSKNRGDFFIKQWELMPLPCLQRESTSFQAMNDRLIRGDQNTSVPFPDQFPMGSQQVESSSFALARGAPGSAMNRFGSGQMDNSPGSGSASNPFSQQQNKFNSSVSPFSSSLQQYNDARGRTTQGPFSKAVDSRGNSTTSRGGNPNFAQNFSGFASKNGGKDEMKGSPGDIEMYKRLKRLEKFDQQLQAKAKSTAPLPKKTSSGIPGLYDTNSKFPNQEEDAMALDELAKHLGIKGTCTVVEKSYFRLTSAPDPSEVRPETVLNEALTMLKSKWENKRSDYKYIDDQFRSLRQDLTVQRIQNDFCVKVYEAHARIALEEADLDQFNQCQTQLRYLYQLGYKGNRTEFLAYQFLYYVFCELETETLRMMKTLTTEEKKQEPIEHALKVRNALAQGNYGRFFKLYRVAPNKGQSLLDVFIDKIRIMCLQKLAVGFVATNIDMSYLSHLLAFDSEKQALKFIEDKGCTTVKDSNGKKRLDCKTSIVALKKAPLKLRRCKK